MFSRLDKENVDIFFIKTIIFFEVVVEREKIKEKEVTKSQRNYAAVKLLLAMFWLFS